MCGRDRAQDGSDYVLVDGFTRTQAAKEAGRLTVTAYLHAFAGVEEARDYAIHTQRDRRNLSDAEIMSVLSLIDKKVTGFKTSSSLAPDGANGGPLPRPPSEPPRRLARPRGRSRGLAKSPLIRKLPQRLSGGRSRSTKRMSKFGRRRKPNLKPTLRLARKTMEVHRATQRWSADKRRYLHLRSNA